MAIREKAFGPVDPRVAETLVSLADLYIEQGRFVEAEPLAARALAIQEKALDAKKAETIAPAEQIRNVASALQACARVYSHQSRFADEETALKRARELVDKAGAAETTLGGNVLASLATVDIRQGRFAEAEPLLRKALDVCQKARGPHPCEHEATLGQLYCELGRFDEAQAVYRKRLAVFEKEHRPGDWRIAKHLEDLAFVDERRGRFADAERTVRQALAILEKSLDPEYPSIVANHGTLARLCHAQGRTEQAETLADRVISAAERASVSPPDLYGAYVLRAEIAWKDGRRGEAVTDLRQAMEISERMRGQASGAEQERAAFFAKFSEAFERMVAWQVELGDGGEMLTAIERGRARSLLDELVQAGADLELGRTEQEREQLRNRELELNQRVAKLEQQLQDIVARGGKPDGDESRNRERLQTSLAEARGALYEHYRDARSSSPVYRSLLAVRAGQSRISQLRRGLIGDDGLMLIYFLGENGGYLLSIGPGKEQLLKLDVDAASAAALGVKPGPLTGARLSSVLTNPHGTGVLQQVGQPQQTGKAIDRLAALWRVLMPKPPKGLLGSDRTIRRLIVVPDGPMALLPFEILVIRSGHPPRYLIDEGPPILYGPSATVLNNLAGRVSVSSSAAVEPVLTVGSPLYAEVARADGGSLSSAATARTRYRSALGKLTPLAYSGWEAKWIGSAFAENGFKAVTLEGAEANEANVRANVAGRRVVHFACHGLVDRSHGNFFGALALTPGPLGQGPSNDGFLTLSEIYQLNLKGCELAILSACQTNHGPEQKGEGVWTLSRGFLVAGARRVVASNWLVDDEAAASLVSQFCSRVALAQKRGDRIHYAQALHDAKRWVREQDKWSDPYYWAAFVLMGPD